MLVGPGPAGFYKTPITFLLIFIIGILSILISTMNLDSTFGLSHPTSSAFQLLIEQRQFWRLISNQLFFNSQSTLIFGLLLIYYFRLFERQMGSHKYAIFGVCVFFLTILCQLAVLVIVQPKSFISGPFGIIFGSFVLFYFTVPKTYSFKIFSIHFSDKSFYYLMGFQVLCAQLPDSLIGSIVGLISGIIYSYESVPLKKLNFPSFLTSFCFNYIDSLLPTNTPPHRTSHLSSQFPPIFRPRHVTGETAPITPTTTTTTTTTTNTYIATPNLFGRDLNGISILTQIPRSSTNQPSTLPILPTTTTSSLPSITRSFPPTTQTDLLSAFRPSPTPTTTTSTTVRGGGVGGVRRVNEDFVHMLMGMGFSREQSIESLITHNNNLPTAIHSLLENS